MYGPITGGSVSLKSGAFDQIYVPAPPASRQTESRVGHPVRAPLRGRSVLSRKLGSEHLDLK